MSDFLESLEPSLEDGFLRDLEKKAIEGDIPIIRHQVRSLLKIILEIKKPQRILEIGTAVGFSAVFMAKECKDCSIITIENYEPRIVEAEKNIAESGLSDRIELIPKDAEEVLKELEGPFDLIFMDAAKGQYLTFLNDAVRLLGDGGVLISDNVLQDEDVLRPRYGVKRRNRTIRTRMREYLYRIKHSEVLNTAVLHIGDGVSISVKGGKE